MSVTVNEPTNTVVVEAAPRGTINMDVTSRIAPVVGVTKDVSTVLSQTVTYVPSVVTGDASLQEHINDPTPHKAYDVDMPSLTLIFENGLI